MQRKVSSIDTRLPKNYATIMHNPVSDWILSMIAWFCNYLCFTSKELPSILECAIPENTEAITPEEREELKVSGEDY